MEHIPVEHISVEHILAKHIPVEHILCGESSSICRLISEDLTNQEFVSEAEFINEVQRI